MESKYMDAALKLYNKAAMKSNTFSNQGFNSLEILELMCELGEETKKINVRDAIVYDYNLCANATVAQADVINYNFEVFVDNYIQKNNIVKLYSKEEVEELLQQQRELCVEKASAILKTQEGHIALFDKFDDLFWLYKDTNIGKYKIDRNSILNAKLKID